MRFDSVILDVDGTLWNSTDIVASAWTQALKECLNRDILVTSDMLKRLFGRTMTKIADLLLPDVEEETRYAAMDECCKYEHNALEKDECHICYPNVIATIKELAGKMPVMIVSNCQSGYIELFLEKTGLKDYVTDFDCFGNNGYSKGENIKAVIARNHLKNPIYVGDTQGDMEASNEAGIPFVFATYGFGNAERWDASIDDFSQLLKL